MNTLLLFAAAFIAAPHHVQTPAPAASPPAARRSTSAPGAPPNEARASERETSEDEPIAVDTTLVTVPVSVADRSGGLIPDLRGEEFKIYENAVEQKIAFFAPVEAPLTIALLIDTSRSTRSRLEEIRAAAEGFIERLRPADRATIISFDDEIRVLSDPVADRELLLRALSRLRPGDGTRLFDAVHAALDDHLSAIEGRKAIVLFTDGADTASRRHTHESTIREVEEADALIYPIFYDTSPGSAHRLVAEAYLRDLVERSGTRLHRAVTPDDLKLSFTRVAEGLRRQYSLGYYPHVRPAPGERRRIEIRVARPGLVVRARPGYTFGQPGDAHAARGARVLRPARSSALPSPPASGRWIDQLPPGADDAPFTSGDIRLRCAAYSGNDARAGSYLTVLLHVEARSLGFEEEGNTRTAALDVAAVAADVGGDAGGSYFHRHSLSERGAGFRRLVRDGRAYSFRFPVRGRGELRLRVAARDVNSGRIGYTSRVIQVPDFEGGDLALSGVVLSGGAAALPRGGSEEAAQALAASDGPLVRRFRRGAKLRYRFGVYNARADGAGRFRLKIGVRVLRDYGEPYVSEEVIVGGASRPDAKRFVHAGALLLNSSVAPGEYFLRIEVTDLLAGGQPPAAQVIDFEVAD